MTETLRVGVGGPVGSGKTALVDSLCKRMRDELRLAVVTNDIYTREDAEFLTRSGALAAERIVGVETGGCPHTAIREDATMNLIAVREIEERLGELDIVFIESGGDNLAATFSPDLADACIYVIDVAAGDKIPRKVGPGLGVMDRDARKMRGERPFLFTNLKTEEGLDRVIGWIRSELLFER